MKEVFTDPDFTKVGFLKSELDSAGIACYIQNQYTNTMMTSVPTAPFWPVLSIIHDADLPAAREIVAQFVQAQKAESTTTAADWICPGCGESVPASFDHCWKCETPRGG